MNITDHDIQAYVDGELAAAERARIDAAIAADVMIAARVEREKRLRAHVRGAYDPVLSEPVPDRLQALLVERDVARVDAPAAAGNVVPMRRRPVALPARWRLPAIAIAASVAALAVSMSLRTAAPVAMDDGQLVARGTLARDLDRLLAGMPSARAGTAIGLTFRDTGGRICRSFTHAQTAVSGLACRDGSRWTLPVVARVESGIDGELRQASSTMPAEVQAAVDARLGGDVFDAAQERAARERGWK